MNDCAADEIRLDWGSWRTQPLMHYLDFKNFPHKMSCVCLKLDSTDVHKNSWSHVQLPRAYNAAYLYLSEKHEKLK